MAAKTAKLRKAFLLDRRPCRVKWFSALEAENLSSRKGIRSSLALATKDTLWISFKKDLTETLLRELQWPSPLLGDLVLLHRPDVETLTALRDCFRNVVFSANDGFLPPKELGEALVAANRANLFIGGSVNHKSKTVTLWRGDLTSLTVPFAAFEPSGTGAHPDFNEFSLTDYGHTIKLGDYEAASDALLYEFDPKFRREQAKRRRASEKTFGASLRRLRKQRGLRREDFRPLSPKTIARIEQGKVKRIHDRTLAAIAKKLDVAPRQIEEF